MKSDSHDSQKKSTTVDREPLLFKQINDRMHRPIGSHSGDGYILKEDEDEDGMYAYEYILIFCRQRSCISVILHITVFRLP